MGSYGDFSDSGNEFVIIDRDIPRHWYNYMWNDSYISFISQVGFGESFAQDNMGRRIPLIAGRNVYLADADSGEFWTVNGLPVDREDPDYRCVHGAGYSELHTGRNGIAGSLRVFVPQTGNCEIWTVTLRNNRPTSVKIKAIPYFRTELDGAYKPQGYNLGTGGYDEALKVVWGRSFKSFGSAESREVYGYLAGFGNITGYDSRKTAFIGTYGEEMSPKALLKSGGCTNSDCVAEKLVFALESTVELAPGEEHRLNFIAGVAFGTEDIQETKARFESNDKIDSAFIEMRDAFSSQVAGVSIETPDSNLNHLFNTWLKHQANMGSHWARVRHNGYRDMASDCECLGAINPDLAWERLKRVLSYQYSNGYAPRTFLDGKLQDHQFADCTVWLTFGVYSFLKEKGDTAMLEEIVPFNDGSESSVYEHIRRSVEFLWHFRGLHGLIRIWGGDWNDCMNQAGLEGKGVSVWLSLAWYRANRQLEEIARLTGRMEDAQTAAKRGAEMREIVDRCGWDGEYYLTAYTDEGIRLGSKECEEGKMFLIPQLWSVLSGIAKDNKAELAMDAVERYLKSDLGTLVSWPAYTRYDPRIGSMTQKPPGVHENGGVYLHPAAWKLAVDSLLGRSAQAEEGLWKLLPFNQDGTFKLCEPYVLGNSYFTEETGYRVGTPGQSWRTATGAWLMKALVNYVFGLQPEMEGLVLRPCLPPSWASASIRKVFRGAVYRIAYEQIPAVEAGENPGGMRIEVNGKEYLSPLLPYEPGGSYEVRVMMSAARA